HAGARVPSTRREKSHRLPRARHQCAPPCRLLRPVANLDEPGGCRADRLVSRLAEPDAGSLALAVGSTLEDGATNRVGHAASLAGGFGCPGEAPADLLDAGQSQSLRERRGQLELVAG